MRYCNTCKVSVEDPLIHCPLCYTTLTKKDDAPELYSYPIPLNPMVTYNLLIKILLFVSISIVVVCFTLNYLTPYNFPWSIIVATSIAYIWLALSNAIKRRHKVGFNLLVQLVFLGFLLIAVGHFIGINYYVYNYVLPALTSSALISCGILMIVQRDKLQSFLLYFFLVGLLGFIPLILYLLKIVTISWPAFGAAVFSLLGIISMFIFAFRDTRNELKKRLNL